ncbi:MAG: succinate dehydrogenase cytochrome b subunit [Bacteroidia bacterium]|nr:succinate dehydrogenase cytochrome b subunit [Bacteroidia bacterium]
MNKFAVLFTSSIGRKLVMSLTGLFLCSFLIIHCAINACLFINDGGLTFNAAAHFMSSNILIRTIEIALFAGFIIHIMQSVVLTMQNKKARGSNSYMVSNTAASKQSTNMGILGTVLFFFIVVHLINFFIGLRFSAAYAYGYDANGHHDVYSNIAAVFSQPAYAIFYIVCMIALGLHLHHGFSSSFQTLGVNHPYYTKLIINVGYLFSVIIPATFAAMPVYFLIKG